MKGIELAERFYFEYGAPMIHEQFPEIESALAIGVAGSGSECFGYDDETSRDHDFEAGFCIFLPDEEIIDRKTAFALERAYAKLPREFMGVKRERLSPVGGARRGVMRISDFLTEKIGTPDGELSTEAWFALPEQSLLEATNGKIFRDDWGCFSEIRQRLAYLPENVRLKKLAGELLIMGQSGQYNYPRCISRGDRAAAQLAMGEFVNSALHAAFLLNKRYMPYYKWRFRALRDLPQLAELHDSLEYLISSGNSEGEVGRKTRIVENVAEQIVAVLNADNLSDYMGAELEGHAYAVNNGITEGSIRNLHILYGV